MHIAPGSFLGIAAIGDVIKFRGGNLNGPAMIRYQPFLEITLLQHQKYQMPTYDYM